MNKTKEKILYAGAGIVRQKGFNNTGLNEILKECSVPKGSFYFFFESKEQFGLQLIDIYTSFMENEMDKIFSDKKTSGVKRVISFIDFTMEMFEKEDFIGGCPLGNLALEMGDVNEKFRMRISEGFESMQAKIKDCLDDAKNVGELDGEINTNTLAAFILNSWEGAVVRMKVEKSVEPLNLLKNFILNSLIIQSNNG